MRGLILMLAPRRVVEFEPTIDDGNVGIAKV
jgi:hypothetical protein